MYEQIAPENNRDLYNMNRLYIYNVILWSEKLI